MWFRLVFSSRVSAMDRQGLGGPVTPSFPLARVWNDDDDDDKGIRSMAITRNDMVISVSRLLS